MRKFSFILCAALALYGCAKTDVAEQTAGPDAAKGIVRLHASVDGSSTKTDILGTAVRWNLEDTISVTAWSGNPYYGDTLCELSPFAIESLSSDGKKAVFAANGLDKEAWTAGITTAAVYPQRKESVDMDVWHNSDKAYIEARFTLPEFQKAGDDTNVGDYDFMISPLATHEAGEEPRLKFIHLMSKLDFQITNYTSSDLTIRRIEFVSENHGLATSKRYTVQQSYDGEAYGEPVISHSYDYSTNRIGVVVEEEDGLVPAGKTINISMMMHPANFSSIHPTLKIVTDCGTLVSTFNNDLQPGTRYTVQKGLSTYSLGPLETEDALRSIYFATYGYDRYLKDIDWWSGRNYDMSYHIDYWRYSIENENSMDMEFHKGGSRIPVEFGLIEGLKQIRLSTGSDISAPVIADLSNSETLERIDFRGHFHADVSNCSNLEELVFYCEEDKGSTLKYDGCSNLKELSLSGLTGISSLELKSYPLLNHLGVNLPNVRTLDLSGAPGLVSLYAEGLASVDLSPCPELESLSLYGIGEWDEEEESVFGEMNFIITDPSRCLTTLDLSHNPKLKYLELLGHRLESLDLSAQKSLMNAGIGYIGNVSEINAPASVKLLILYGIPLKEVSLSQCKDLQALRIFSCGLKALDLTANTSMINLDCVGNDIADLDLHHLPSGLSMTVGGQTRLMTVTLREDQLKERFEDESEKLEYEQIANVKFVINNEGIQEWEVENPGMGNGGEW